MTGTTGMSGRVTIRCPRLRRAPFAATLADWLRTGPGRHVTRAPLTIVIVPEYLGGAPRAVLADLATRDPSDGVVGIVGYGGRSRGRHAVAEARSVLVGTGATVLATALGLDTGRVRAHGFGPDDDLLLRFLLDEAAAVTGSGAATRVSGSG